MDPTERINQIETDYGARISAAPEDQRVALQLEREQAKNAVYQEAQQARDRADIVAEALKEFPHAPALAVSGSTKEEIVASAKSLHEHYGHLLELQRDSIRQEIEQKAKQNMYGRPTAGGGQSDIDGAGGGLQTQPTQLEGLIDHVEGVLRNKTGIITAEQHDALVGGIGDSLIQRQLHHELPDGLEERGGIKR